jgi:hypothetical protein
VSPIDSTVIIRPNYLITRPQHTILDLRCRESTFEICQLIAQNSDPGRRVLMDGNIVPILVQLSADTSASNVVNSCNVLNALAHTGTYRSELVGVRDAMERITKYVSVDHAKKYTVR